jgi:hypothetical protein
LLDGTFTIVRRALRREAIWKAHRTHLYQRAVGTGLDHRAVLLPYLAWMVCAGGASVAVSVRGPRTLAAASAAMLIMLAVVWAWVVRRERRAKASSKAPVGA